MKKYECRMTSQGVQPLCLRIFFDLEYILAVTFVITPPSGRFYFSKKISTVLFFKKQKEWLFKQGHKFAKESHLPHHWTTTQKLEI